MELESRVVLWATPTKRNCYRERQQSFDPLLRLLTDMKDVDEIGPRPIGWSHIYTPVKDMLQIDLEVLEHPNYKPDQVLSDHHTIKSIQNSLGDTSERLNRYENGSMTSSRRNRRLSFCSEFICSPINGRRS